MADGRGKKRTSTKPSTGTSADRRKSDNGTVSKKPGPARGSPAASKGSAAGGRASRKNNT